MVHPNIFIRLADKYPEEDRLTAALVITLAQNRKALQEFLRLAGIEVEARDPVKGGLQVPLPYSRPDAFLAVEGK